MPVLCVDASFPSVFFSTRILSRTDAACARPKGRTAWNWEKRENGCSFGWPHRRAMYKKLNNSWIIVIPLGYVVLVTDADTRIVGQVFVFKRIFVVLYFGSICFQSTHCNSGKSKIVCAFVIFAFWNCARKYTKRDIFYRRIWRFEWSWAKVTCHQEWTVRNLRRNSPRKKSQIRKELRKL